MNLTLDLQRSLVDLVMADELCDASTADPWQIDDMRGQILDLDEAHSNQMMRCVRYTCCSTQDLFSLVPPRLEAKVHMLQTRLDMLQLGGVKLVR